MPDVMPVALLDPTWLQTVWFLLWTLLWAVYFMLDGFDFGLGTLMPFMARNDLERRIMYNASGPFWDGNEVWLITAGGVTFAAFPKAYATLFSALYAPLLMLLFALIFRAVAFEFRNKVDSPKWRKFWDICKFFGSFVPALLLGVAFANLFQGIPIDGEGVYHGNLLKLLSPYGLMGGVFFVLMFAHHGALWLAVKSAGPLHDRAVAWSRTLWLLLLAAAVLFLGATAVFTNIYASIIQTPPLAVFPILAVLLLLASRFARAGTYLAWLAHAGFIVCVTFFGVLGMYPAMIPSSLSQAYSVTAMNAAASPTTLKIMLVVVIIFVPLVIAYQVFVYVLFRKKITAEDLQRQSDLY
ncbi:MAG: cytochrome d ubiquinol oxidase subunit II [Deltaproteobacteria bacterium]|nr:cytochrome d ubiquinol oxidase subunit II [Deltaproteobacteria bacterium]